MNSKIISLLFSLFFLVLTLNLISSLIVNSDYIKIYPGEEGKVAIEIENNENFDIEDVSVGLILDDVPFIAVGNSEKNIDELDEDDDDSVTFTLKSSTDIIPGDYNIPYIIKYFSAENSSIKKERTGSFGLRVSAKTELDFGVEVKDNAIVGDEGRISLEIINKGLGEIKSVSVQIFPNGFELLSKDKIFIGSIGSDDTDIASFDVIYKTSNPTLSAKVDYKDFDNNEQSEIVNFPIKVYTIEEALNLGLIKKNRTGIYILILGIVIILWIIYRKIKKRRKRKERYQKEISGK
jgi:hypothetical protein